MTTFKVWTSPKNGQQRIYISGFGATQVWVERCEKNVFGFDYTIRAFNENRTTSELANLTNEAERAIFESAGEVVKDFDKVKDLAV